MLPSVPWRSSTLHFARRHARGADTRQTRLRHELVCAGLHWSHWRGWATSSVGQLGRPRPRVTPKPLRWLFPKRSRGVGGTDAVASQWSLLNSNQPPTNDATHNERTNVRTDGWTDEPQPNGVEGGTTTTGGQWRDGAGDAPHVDDVVGSDRPRKELLRCVALRWFVGLKLT